MSDNTKPNSFDRLQKLVGFDPSRPPSATGQVLDEVLKELVKEREVKAKEAARQTLGQALELHTKAMSAKRQFDSQWQKFEKELGKLMNGLERSLNGQPPPADEEGAAEGQQG